ncbi:MAG TPA: DUF4179 domain-containing protein [Pelotomaculum sp.]|nr:DUF4179 domain-containing protein [Pelotomaculum sp.]
MSDIFHEILMEDAARINVSPMTWKQVKKGRKHARGKAVWQRRLLVYGAAAVLAIVAIGASGFVSPVMAKVLQRIPIIGELYSFNEPKLNQYASDTNPSATDKGITVSLPKIYYDGACLDIIYAIQVPEGYEPVSESPQITIPDNVQLNGIPLSQDNSGFKIESAGSGDSLVSTNMYRGELYYYLASAQTPQNVTLTITIYQVGTVEGNWTLSVPVSSAEINKAIETVFPENASTTYDGITLTANKVSKGLVYTDISMQLRQTLQEGGKPKGTMTLDNTFGVPMFFNVLDINLQFMESTDIHHQHFQESGNEKIWDFTIRCITPANDVKSIVIEPVWFILNKEDARGNSPHVPQLAVTVPLN